MVLWQHLQDLLRDWLRALVIADTPAGYPLRLRLRDRLVAACARRTARLHRPQLEAAAAPFSRRDRGGAQVHRAQPRPLHRDRLPAASRRARPEVPREITDEIMVELLALLGPISATRVRTSCGASRRTHPHGSAQRWRSFHRPRARDIPPRLRSPSLTEAYYIDDEEDGSGFHEDGIRHHDVLRSV